MLTAAVLTSPVSGATVAEDTILAWTPSTRAAPVAVISSPAPGSTYVEGTAVALTGTVTDALGGAIVGTWSSSLDGALGTGNSLSPTSLSVGAHVLTYGGTDSQGDAATPVTVSLTITAAPALPTVTLVAPVDGASVVTGAPVVLAATATGETAVSFSVDGGGALAAAWNAGLGQWERSYTPATSKAYSFTATATGAGGSASSPARAFTASAAPPANVPPTVTVVAPAADAALTAGASYTLAATANDSDGAVAGVTFSVDGGAAQATAWNAGTSRWEIEVTLPATGSHSVTATATDNSDASTTSAPVSYTTAASGGTTTVEAHFQQGVLPTAAYAGASDTYLTLNTPAGKSGTSTTNRSTTGISGNEHACLIRFDLSSIPTNATVTGAILRNKIKSKPAAGHTADFYRLRRAWTAADATWNSASAGVAWATPGAKDPAIDQYPDSICTTSNPTSVGTWVDAPLDVATVQAWVSDPGVNFGIVVRANQLHSWEMHSSDAAAADRPEFIVTYTIPA